MTKVSGTIDVSGFTTDAKFRNWGSICSTALQACGLVKTSDTGQINWTTVTKPVATNTLAGYEIYRFNDSLQATAPVFIRINYGSSNVASGNSPQVWYVIGTTSDGAGTVSGLTVTFTAAGSTTVPSNAAMPYAFTHTADGYCLMHFGMGLNTSFSSSASPGWLLLDRTRNSTTGAATADGLGIWRYLPSSGVAQHLGQNYNTSTAYTTVKEVMCGNLTSISNSISYINGISTPLYRTYMYLGGSAVASMGAVGYYNPDIATGSMFSTTPFGATPRTYLTIGTTSQYWSPFGSSGPITDYAAVLWED